VSNGTAGPLFRSLPSRQSPDVVLAEGSSLQIMWNASPLARTIAALLVGASLSAAEGRAAAGASGQPEVHALLDVPFVSQTPELCGGAAVAMVMRYWGERDVHPQDFAFRVGAGAGGILTGVLAAAVRERGWQALVLPADDDAAHTRTRSEIDRGRPLIALVEVGPRTFHYVVIVGSTDQDVVVHDPARAPYRVLRWAEFDRAWRAAGRWALLVLPPGGPRPDDGAVRLARASPGAGDRARVVTPCDTLVERGAQLAIDGDRDGAERALVAATRLCPGDPAPWRELAGVRFSQSRWSEARDLALSAVRLAPSDGYAWQLVATSRYLMGDTMGALDAWNRAGEPRLDTTDIHGAGRTRQPVVVRAAGLEPRQVLTSAAFQRALRRLRDLPVASSARMNYAPTEGGLAKLDVLIDERKVAPTGWLAVVTSAGSALLLHAVGADVAGALGAGELMSASWRWSAGRPRVALGIEVPSPRWLRGTVSFDGSWERQSYEAAPSSGPETLVREERRRAGVHLADWATGRLRWQAGAALDHLREHGDLVQTPFVARDYLAMDGTLDLRLGGDRLALSASAGWWVPLARGNRFGTGGLLAAWRSIDDTTRPSWSAVTAVAVASRAAPLALWQGAGTGQGRSGLLRAHPLLHGGVLTGPVFGRGVVRVSLEHVRPVWRTPVGRVSIAGFVDGARAWHRLSGLDASRLFLDAGVGLRLHAPGRDGAIRIDVAHGLRGGGAALSASWGAVWPR
jgi:hypothetical protein